MELNMKLSKKDIKRLTQKILTICKENDYKDISIYYNDKRVTMNYYSPMKMTRNICPLDYFEYANEKHILSMTFEGPLYHEINGYIRGGCERKIRNLLAEYGLYYELGNAWNFSVFPIDGDYSEIEFTDYRKRKVKVA